MKLSKRFFLWIVVVWLALPWGVFAQDSRPQVYLLNASAPVAPAMAEYIERGIRTAELRGAEAVVIQLDTPGGDVNIMLRIMQAMHNSSVPIVVYVAPPGAMAASAGALLTLAGHGAAMAPQTTIGAASPVGGSGEDLGETMEAKLKNMLRAQVRTIVERRGAEAVTLAEQMIESAAAVSANEALEAGLIDWIASDLDDLLRQMDGFVVVTLTGEQTLNTAQANVIPLNLSFIEQLLVVLTNPNIIFLLITVGVQAILIEISSPGGWVAGFLGVVCLSLATYGLGVLPVNWFGLVFIILSFVLFILDIKAPTHGALTVAGVTSLIVGGLVLFNTPSLPDFSRVSVPLVVGVSISSGLIFFALLVFALRAQSIPHLMGRESLIGRSGVKRAEFKHSGIIQVAGEQWSAELSPGEEPLQPGDPFEVVSIEGLKLYIRKSRQ